MSETKALRRATKVPLCGVVKATFCSGHLTPPARAALLPSIMVHGARRVIQSVCNSRLCLYFCCHEVHDSSDNPDHVARRLTFWNFIAQCLHNLCDQHDAEFGHCWRYVFMSNSSYHQYLDCGSIRSSFKLLTAFFGQLVFAASTEASPPNVPFLCC